MKKSRNSARRLGNSATVSLVQATHCLLELTVQQQRHYVATAVDAVFNAFHVFLARRVQNEGRDLLGKAEAAWVTYANSQTPECSTGKCRLDVAQAVMPGMPTALLELDLTRQQIEFIVQHQHLFRHHLEEAHQGTCRLARTIHEGDGFGNYDCLALVPPLGNPGREAFFQVEGDAQVVSNVVGKPEACVMPCRFVLGPGISQPDDQTYGCSCAHEQFLK